MNPKLDLLLPIDLQQKIIEFTLISGIDKFIINQAGEKRRWCNLNKINNSLSKEVYEFSNKCFNNIGITEFEDETLLGNFISFNEETAFIHPHTDTRNDNGDWHVRINFIVQKPTIGGIPVIEGNKIDVEERNSWINFASENIHQSTPVEGSKQRIGLSLGKYIKQEIIKPYYERYHGN